MKLRDRYKIVYQERMNKSDTYQMVLRGNTSAIKNPGEFVEITIPGTFLPRPFSIAYHQNDLIFIVYKVVGEGTKKLSQMRSGEELEVLTGLGNGFDLTVDTKTPLLVGGGTGAAPLYGLAHSLITQKEVNPIVILGFKNEEEAFYCEKFGDLDVPFYVSLESNTQSRLVTDVMPLLESEYDYFYACGPKGMLKAVCEATPINGEVSLESRMACGIGQCKCCSIETTEGMKTLCKDGPVLKRSLVRW